MTELKAGKFMPRQIILTDWASSTFKTTFDVAALTLKPARTKSAARRIKFAISLPLFQINKPQHAYLPAKTPFFLSNSGHPNNIYSFTNPASSSSAPVPQPLETPP